MTQWCPHLRRRSGASSVEPAPTAAAALQGHPDRPISLPQLTKGKRSSVGGKAPPTKARIKAAKRGPDKVARRAEQKVCLPSHVPAREQPLHENCVHALLRLISCSGSP